MNKGAQVQAAIHFVRYWQNAYKIRMRGLTPNSLDPPIVHELINWLKWNGGMHAVDAMEHATSLNQMLHVGREEIREIVEQAQVAADAQPFLVAAQAIQSEMEAASALLEQLSES